ncbi:MAG: hypothetical protein BWK78_06960 [Thiotrichaceae bacterium IS1]|nr:MAG: hypothetical protein BWK78_06960 [Thiotrichaceae bacterium IS1]
MKTKAFVNGLFALALLTPLGVQANGGNDTGGVLTSVGTEESCLATFSVSDQILTIPCVEVVMGTETVLYSAQLQQVEEGRFARWQSCRRRWRVTAWRVIRWKRGSWWCRVWRM